MEIPGEKLVIKLWETLADKGIGTLLKPWQIRREGRATVDVRRDEMLALAQAEVDAAAIRNGQKLLLPTGELVARPASPTYTELPHQVDAPMLSLPYVVQVAEQNSKVEAVRQEVSIAKAVLFAERELQADPSEPSPEIPQDDWLLRWRESAAGISSEELQQLWGKVLAARVGRVATHRMEWQNGSAGSICLIVFVRIANLMRH